MASIDDIGEPAVSVCHLRSKCVTYLDKVRIWALLGDEPLHFGQCLVDCLTELPFALVPLRLFIAHVGLLRLKHVNYRDQALIITIVVYQHLPHFLHEHTLGIRVCRANLRYALRRGFEGECTTCPPVVTL